MGPSGRSPLVWVAACSSLVAGVMAETLDSDLIGVVAAGVCLAVLLVVIIAFVSFCCYRRIESQRTSSEARKNSGTTSTNGISPRWAPAIMPSSGMPMYNVPAAEPVMYAMPASPYYLGQYAPKFMDTETLEYMRHQYVDHRRRYEDYEDDTEQHVRRHSHHGKRKSRDKQEVTTQEETTTAVVPLEEPVQLNGNVLHEFAASSVNYRVIRKQHKHEMMPEWLRKSYGENERTMDLEDEGSRTSSEFSPEDLDLPPGSPEEVVRAQVSPQHSPGDAHDVLRVSPGFTIVDFIDPEQRPGPSFSSSSHVLDGHHHHHHHHEEERHHDDVNTTSDVKRTTVTTTTTTYFTSDGQLTSEMTRREGGEGTDTTAHLLPESSSTPRAAHVLQLEVKGEEEDELPEMHDPQLHHYRMRDPGQGSIQILPSDVAYLAGGSG